MVSSACCFYSINTCPKTVVLPVLSVVAIVVVVVVSAIAIVAVCLLFFHLPNSSRYAQPYIIRNPYIYK